MVYYAIFHSVVKFKSHNTYCYLNKLNLIEQKVLKESSDSLIMSWLCSILLHKLSP